MNDLCQRTQGLIDFPWVLKDCRHVRIKRDDARALFVTGRVLIGASPAEIVLGENVIPVSMGCITLFTVVSLRNIISQVDRWQRAERQRGLVPQRLRLFSPVAPKGRRPGKQVRATATCKLPSCATRSPSVGLR